jgi:hypothetical protein
VGPGGRGPTGAVVGTVSGGREVTGAAGPVGGTVSGGWGATGGVGVVGIGPGG